MKHQFALVTGTTSGLGQAAARILAVAGLAGREQDPHRLASLAQNFAYPPRVRSPSPSPPARAAATVRSAARAPAAKGVR